MRAFVLITCLLLLSACTTPVATPTPSAIVLSEDMHFEWVPPNLGHRMEVFISAGRYSRTDEEQDMVYYESGSGLVSRAYVGQPAKKVKGGIGYMRGKGQYFIWELVPSSLAQTPWLLISNMTEAGPLVRAYSAKVPKENESSLHLEK